MEQKKQTNAQLQRRIKNAVLHIDRTKETKSIFFNDKGLRLTIDEDYAIIETGFHRHVFSNFTSMGISRPYLYTKRIVEMALEEANKGNIDTESGFSYVKLVEVLKAKEDKAEYNIAVYYEWWLQLIFSYLYSIGENDAESFLVYEAYLHHIARNGILLSEKTEDITNKQFIDKVCDNIKEFVNGLDEYVVFPKKTDDEVMRENIEAVQEQMQEEALKDEQQ